MGKTSCSDELEMLVMALFTAVVICGSMVANTPGQHPVPAWRGIEPAAPL